MTGAMVLGLAAMAAMRETAPGKASQHNQA
jgi:hypothetical protein